MTCMLIFKGDAHGVMVIVRGNKLSGLSSNLDGIVCISHLLRKDMHPTILPSAMGK